MRGGPTRPHRPWLVASHSTRPLFSLPPPAHSFHIGPGVINNNLAVTLIGAFMDIALSPPGDYWCEALVVGVRDCTVVGGGATLLKEQSTPVREFSGG